MSKPVVYHYPRCSTCRKALAWLSSRGIEVEKVDIVESPPSNARLQAIVRAGVPLRKLFNTSGESYRAGGFKERLPTLSEDEAIAALSRDGKLIKRPLLVADASEAPAFALAGFDEAAWDAALRR